MSVWTQEVYWPEVCGNASQYDAFWSYSLTIDTPSPDLTQCFQRTALTWATCGLLWILAAFYAPYLWRQAIVHPWGSISRWNLLQMTAISSLIAVNVCELVRVLITDTDGRPDNQMVTALYLGIGVRIPTYVLAAVLTHWAFRRGQHSPGALFMFWLVQLIAGAVVFRSGLLKYHREGATADLFTLITGSVTFGLILVQFSLTLFADPEALTPPPEVTSSGRYGDEGAPLLGGSTAGETSGVKPKPCPILKASFLSRMYFGWFFPKVYNGYKRPLTNADMWDIQPADCSDHIVPRFEAAWDKQVTKYNNKHGRTNNASRPNQPNSMYQNFNYGSNSKQKTNNYGAIGDNSTKSYPDNQNVNTERETPQPSKKKKYPSLVGALVTLLGPYYFPMGLTLVGMDITTIMNPLILSKLIGLVQTPGQTYTWQGVLLAVIMFIFSSLNMLFFCHYFMSGYVTGLRTRTAIISAIYRKSLRLSNLARKDTTVGEIVNIMSVDTEKVVQMFLGIHFIWSAPLVLVVALYFQYQIIGPACFAGLIVLFFVIPLNSAILAKKIRKLQKEQMVLKDQRIKLMNQVLNGIKVLKLYAWEPHFQAKIEQLRAAELDKLRRVSVLSAATYSLWFLSPFMVALLDFIVYVFTSPDRSLDPQIAFTTLSFINAQNFQFNMLPQVIMWLVQGTVSIKRIERFFCLDEIDGNNVQEDLMEDSAVKIDKGTFTWGEEKRITLKNVTFDVPSGSLVGVVGQVGSGKSSLISAILGEMEKIQGKVIVNGSLAYIPQQAWIQNLTMRDNVLFSRPYTEARYQDVLRACALEPDLETLPGGDMTEIGERGINLSGGQKQRVSLARGVYQDADIYLLDDPLSAVDAHVGKHIFKHVVGPDGLLKRKTRILVTHSVTHLSQMDLIVTMKDGEISEIGAYDELLSRQGAFSEFISTYLAENSEELADTEDIEELRKLKRLTSTSSVSPLERSLDHSSGSGHSLASAGKASGHGSTSVRDTATATKSRLRRRRKTKSVCSSVISGRSHAKSKAEHEEELRRKTQLVEEEKTAEGTISGSVLKAYAKAATMKYVIFSFVALGIYVSAMIGSSIWLSLWTADALLNATVVDVPPATLRLGVYGAFGLLQMLTILLLSVVVVMGSISASRHLHSSLLSKVLRCPMSFFDTTPIGRILNRFSKDVDIMDTNIQQYLLNLFLVGAPLLTTIFVIGYTMPILLVGVVPIGILFVLLQRFYVYCSRQIKRIDSVKKSPIYAFFSETLNGTSSIRAYRQEERFIKHSDALLDDSQRVWFEVFSSNRWVNIWVEVVGDLLILMVAIFTMVEKDVLSPSLAGLALTYALQLSFSLVFVIRNTCDLETYIVSVERIKEYADLPPEAPWLLPLHRPLTGWPVEGAIDFRDYSVRYREGMDLVLNRVTCHMEPREKVGIVGRTGAGKSSMTLGLFRILEAADGQILIDGINIADMGLHDLRSKLTIIPQDPVLFSGSLRFNLDPAEMHSDDEIWRSLEQAHLRTFVDTLPDNISYECGENGENLSVGQRQLVCLARALLRKTKILVLDEATAAVDMETDDLIQSTIRSEFISSTVITIAHRLNTILDYDRVIVMAEGHIKEVDSPSNLQNNKGSLFYAMAKDAGIL